MIKLMSLLVKSVGFIIAGKSSDFVDALTTKSYVPRQLVSPRPTTTTAASSQQNKKQHKLLQQEKQQQKIDVVDAGISGSPQTSQYEESNLLKKAQAVLQAKVEAEELETMSMWELGKILLSGFFLCSPCAAVLVQVLFSCVRETCSSSIKFKGRRNKPHARNRRLRDEILTLMNNETESESE